ncbi:hypothetical protein [Gynuella sp.]|uniref:hypothetical protein n=1 Tax=Gynuella sp. TaxID=2969146 RepID=UPI003D0E848A
MSDDIFDLEAEKKLKKELANLTESIEPPDYLWDRIQSQLQTPVPSDMQQEGRQNTRWLFYGVAASFAFAFLALGVTVWGQFNATTLIRQIASADRGGLAVTSQLISPINLTDRFRHVSPEARAVVEANMEVIQQALNEIYAALAQDPDNHDLNEILQETLEQKHRLLETADMLSL